MEKPRFIRKRKIRSRLMFSIWVCVIPFIILFGTAIIQLYGYYKQYDQLVRNITGVNEYNMSFKSEMDEMMYRIIIGSANWSDPEEKLEGEDPERLISEAKVEFEDLKEHVTEPNVETDIDALLKLLDILDERVKDILVNVEEGGHYDENMEMLDMNIRTLTSLIQEDIQKYIYDEAINMEMLRREVAAGVINSVRIQIVLLVLITGLIIYISGRQAKRITNPITGLCDMTEKFAGGDFTVSYHTDRDDEMETLANSFNSMVGEIKKLVDDIHKEQENAKEAELRLLQEQINPHFLYNTLDAIVWLTESGEKKKAIQMIQELSNFFRISLSKGESQITVKDEREHVRSYLEIQHHRYQDILDYNIDFADDILEYHIQKLTLQPIVENALYHGIKNKRGKGMIKVTGMEYGADIIFTVEDNGRGMNEQELSELKDLISGKKSNDRQHGFGMANVEKRIKMQYGEKYGMTVESTFGEGTIVTVRIPKV